MGSMTMNVRISGSLADFVSSNVGEDGLYEHASEYIRDLIRRDKAQVDAEQLDELKAELTRAFATPDQEYVYVTAEDVIARNNPQRKRA